MFWLPAVVNALQSNNAQTNAKSMNDMQNSAGETGMIAQKRAQRNQIADNVGTSSNVDIDSIVNSLFSNRKRTNTGGFSGYGFFQ